ncbi:23S rRNA (adenine(2503)-C(2))-methyltransferase RlmN [Holophaga foetida]|uniref:23S rRNA (adenine(2503)-C(2))-methyltransferase RlmN n=1 Tax=Holophaga foetida TaxID=35839 RepID=UPI00030BBF13|nr:23S rRNA (adenine(2503)-C(2))-methyltransferase RlmN [Holophaga foetida]
MLPEDFTAMGAPGRAEHIFAMIQRPWEYRDGFPRLSREIREWLVANLDTALPEVAERHASEDGSTKLMLRLGDGECIEAVHMPREVRNPRVTLCVSSQVGCAMGCAFCATGTLGIRRNLSAGEIVGQVLAALRELGPERPHAITLVFMGMGEPLHNLEQVHRAIQILNHTRGLNISTRRITVSTSGLVPGIERLAHMEPRPWLAVSLNATTDEARSALMPVNRAWGLARLREALDAWSLGDRERLTIEYVLVAGQNDTMEDAERLAEWMGELRRGHNVNLIRLNEHEAASFREPDEAQVNAFVARLKALNCFVTVRKSRGRDIQGACGQLVKKSKGPSKRIENC